MPSTNTIETLRGRARMIRLLALALALICPLLLIIVHWFGENSSDMDSLQVPAMQRQLLDMVDFIALVPIVFGLLTLSRLCAEYAQGQLFSNRAVRQYQLLAYALLWASVLNLALPPLTWLPSVLDSVSKDWVLVFSLSKGDLLLIVLSLFALLLAGVMRVAHAIQKENAAIV